MKKVIVIGCPGSGKSVFSREVHNKIGLPLYHLDMMFWNFDKTTVERHIFLERLSKALEEDEWIIDGNYISSMDLRMDACDTVIFLDYSLEVCLDGIRSRLGKERSDMPWVETEEDAEFIDFIKNFEMQTRPEIIELLKKHANKNIYIFKNRSDASEFLEGII